MATKRESQPRPPRKPSTKPRKKKTDDQETTATGDPQSVEELLNVKQAHEDGVGVPATKHDWDHDEGEE